MAVLGVIAWTGPAWALVNVDAIPTGSGAEQTAGGTAHFTAVVTEKNGHKAEIKGTPKQGGHIGFAVPKSVADNAASVQLVRKDDKGQIISQSDSMTFGQFEQAGIITLIPVASSATPQTSTSAVTFSFGASVIVPHETVSWQGTGAGGVAATTFDNAQFMPTLGLSAPLWALSPDLKVTASANLLIPTDGTSTRTVSTPLFTGTESFHQGLAGDAFLNLSGSGGLNWNFIVGAGLAVNHTRTTAVFAAAGDNFSVGHTDTVPAVQAGIWGTMLDGRAMWTVMAVDWLAGRTVTMPDGTVASFATEKAGNVVGVTGKVVVPFMGWGVDQSWQQWTIASDVRLKRDIVQVGELPNGIHLYRFHYAWSDQLYVGVMAQEVQQIMPDAVVPGPYGYLAVDYGKVGTELKTWDEFVASNPVPASLKE